MVTEHSNFCFELQKQPKCIPTKNSSNILFFFKFQIIFFFSFIRLGLVWPGGRVINRKGPWIPKNSANSYFRRLDKKFHSTYLKQCLQCEILALVTVIFSVLFQIKLSHNHARKKNKKKGQIVWFKGRTLRRGLSLYHGWTATLSMVPASLGQWFCLWAWVIFLTVNLVQSWKLWTWMSLSIDLCDLNFELNLVSVNLPSWQLKGQCRGTMIVFCPLEGLPRGTSYLIFATGASMRVHSLQTFDPTPRPPDHSNTNSFLLKNWRRIRPDMKFVSGHLMNLDSMFTLISPGTLPYDSHFVMFIYNCQNGSSFSLAEPSNHTI